MPEPGSPEQIGRNEGKFNKEKIDFHIFYCFETRALETENNDRENQDSAICQNGVFGIADGMGGHAGGKIASFIAAETIEGYLKTNIKPELSLDDVQIQITEAFLEAQKAIEKKVLEMEASNPYINKMGTTATVGILHQGYFIVGHLGDTRASLIRGNRIISITEDQNMLGVYLRTEANNKDLKYDQRELEKYPDAPGLSHLSTLLGGQGRTVEDVSRDIKLYCHKVENGDKILFTSDGIHDQVRYDEIEELSKQAHSIDDFTRKLMQKSIDISHAGEKRSHHDDMSCLLLEFEEKTVLKPELSPEEKEKITVRYTKTFGEGLDKTNSTSTKPLNPEELFKTKQLRLNIWDDYKKITGDHPVKNAETGMTFANTKELLKYALTKIIESSYKKGDTVSVKRTSGDVEHDWKFERFNDNKDRVWITNRYLDSKRDVTLENFYVLNRNKLSIG